MSVRLPSVMAVLVVAVITSVAGCSSGADTSRRSEGDGMTQRSIEAVQDEHTEAWMAIPGVVGTGIGRCEGEPCIKVFVSERSDRIDAAIPSEVEGYPVQIEETGAFRAGDTTGG